MNRIPGTNGDAIRSLQNLPGVARTLTGLLIVRGSAPQDTQIFIDGTAIPYVYHLFGLSSVVPTEILDRLDFYPGNFSAQYGRAMGGVVDVGIRDPKTDGIHAMAQADLIDVRLVVEGPELSQQDKDRGLLVLDGTWRLAHRMEKFFYELPPRSLPPTKTAYPRLSRIAPDPAGGLATIEAIYAAYRILGRPCEGLLDEYHWANEFLERNGWL